MRLVSHPTGEVLGEISEPSGVKAIYSALDEDSRSDPRKREAAYCQFFCCKAAELYRRRQWPGRIPAVISGMASSTVGWKELPYATVPFPLDGSELVYDRLELETQSSVSDVFLVSGVATADDILRGEESELIGLHAASQHAGFADSDHSDQETVVILPGTHSKQIRVRHGNIIGFQTFMTGELFELLSTHSLLKVSVQWPVTPEGWNLTIGADQQAFCEGVDSARRRGLAGSLFRVRTRTVLDRVPAAENSWFLSGLLIGAELSEIASTLSNTRIFLAGAAKFLAAYQLALDRWGMTERVTVIPEGTIRYSTVRAHQLFLEHHLDR